MMEQMMVFGARRRPSRARPGLWGGNWMQNRSGAEANRGILVRSRKAKRKFWFKLWQPQSSPYELARMGAGRLRSLVRSFRLKVQEHEP
jgi:hypothetical protein